MEITWYGYSCFRLAERGMATVVTDPYEDRLAGFDSSKLNADIVTVSQGTRGNSPGNRSLQGIIGTPYVVTGPGEYEIGGVFITGIQTGRQKEPETAQNTLYVFDFNALTVAHLGELDRPLTQAEIEAIGTVNIALVPIGSEHGLNAARAAEVISLLEPKIVIPMHYAVSGGLSLDSLSKFLKEMGLSEVAKQPSLKITSATLPEEMQVIVLDDRRG